MTATEVNKNRRYDLNMFDWIKKNYHRALAFLSILILPVVCGAEGTDGGIGDFTEFSTHFSSMADQVQSAITTVIPYVLPLVGIILAIMVGIRVVKRITGRA